jgi:hypothetical protein
MCSVTALILTRHATGVNRGATSALPTIYTALERIASNNNYFSQPLHPHLPQLVPLPGDRADAWGILRVWGLPARPVRPHPSCGLCLGFRAKPTLSSRWIDNGNLIVSHAGHVVEPGAVCY